MSTEIDYERWYPDVKPVMTVQDMAELLSTNDQIIRLYVREGTLPAHRREGGRKMHFLRHEVFNWLLKNRYIPDSG
jgi:excisionase family DNA binding protein